MEERKGFVYKSFNQIEQDYQLQSWFLQTNESLFLHSAYEDWGVACLKKECNNCHDKTIQNFKKSSV